MKTSIIILLIQGILIGIALVYLQRQIIKDIKNAIKEYLENTNITINQHIDKEWAKKITQDYINSELEKSNKEE